MTNKLTSKLIFSILSAALLAAAGVYVAKAYDTNGVYDAQLEAAKLMFAPPTAAREVETVFDTVVVDLILKEEDMAAEEPEAPVVEEKISGDLVLVDGEEPVVVEKPSVVEKVEEEVFTKEVFTLEILTDEQVDETAGVPSEVTKAPTRPTIEPSEEPSVIENISDELTVVDMGVEQPVITPPVNDELEVTPIEVTVELLEEATAPSQLTEEMPQEPQLSAPSLIDNITQTITQAFNNYLLPAPEEPLEIEEVEGEFVVTGSVPAEGEPVELKFDLEFVPI